MIENSFIGEVYNILKKKKVTMKLMHIRQFWGIVGYLIYAFLKK